MTPRPTTLVESDQLAQAAVNILKTEDFVPKNSRWRFAKSSKAHKDYEKAVEDIRSRRRSARERAIDEKLKKERGEADAAFERTKTSAETEHKEKTADARKPFDDTEAKARSERDAAIAAANLAYQQAIAAANRAFQRESAVLDQKRDTLIGEAKSARAELLAAIEAKRDAAMLQLAQDLKTISLEGPMRVVEDREAWSVEDRRKALVGVIDMAGRDDVDAEYADLCLRNVAGYVFQDRFLKPEAQRHRLMGTYVLEAMVDLARRTPENRPTVIKYLHEIVVHNPGHTSPMFIKQLSELYVLASDDTETRYARDPIENERIFDVMREQIADTLKLTPRRSQVPPAAADGTQGSLRVSKTTPTPPSPAAASSIDPEITADLDARDLLPLEASSGHGAEKDAIVEQVATPNGGSTSRPPPMPAVRRGKRSLVPEGKN
jgi:hypothetical protein